MKTRQFDAVVFDMDGVIFDSERAVMDCWTTLAEKYNIKETRKRTLITSVGVICINSTSYINKVSKEYLNTLSWQNTGKECVEILKNLK